MNHKEFIANIDWLIQLFYESENYDQIAIKNNIKRNVLKFSHLIGERQMNQLNSILNFKTNGNNTSAPIEYDVPNPKKKFKSKKETSFKKKNNRRY